jgi:hypothetical protein
MKWLWNWGGEFFGYREGDALFAYYGLQIGAFEGDEVYGPDGRYIGEIMSNERLATCTSKKDWEQPGFIPTMSGECEKHPTHTGLGAYAGFEDFPAPDDFR